MPYAGTGPNVADRPVWTFTGDGATTSFALTIDGQPFYPGAAGGVDVFVARVIQWPGEYSIAGNAVVFSSPPANGAAIHIRSAGRVLDLPTPAATSVGTAQIIDDAVTADKLASGLRLVKGTELVLNPYATSQTVTQAHGLGGVPDFTTAVLECLTGDLDYLAGDILDITGSYQVDQATTSQRSFMVTKNSTNIVLLTSNTVLALQNKNPVNGGNSITASRWKLTITPWRLV